MKYGFARYEIRFTSDGCFMGNRRQSRECALQMLYQLDITSCGADEVVRTYWLTNEVDDDVRQFANELFRGVTREAADIDSRISAVSTNWKISRMAAVDKNIIRVAIYELIHCEDIPSKVTINEAVEIAKKFGAADSGAFVNGILDNISKSGQSSQSG